MKNTAYLWLMAGQVATTAVVQLVPMLVLQVEAYAVYAAVYLGFAACLAIQYAAISDVWARVLRRADPTDTLMQSSQAALTALALVCGATAGIGAFIVTGHPLLVTGGTVAVAAAMFRTGVAYRLIAEGRVRRAGVSELFGATAAAAASATVMALDAYSAPAALLCWAAGSATASVATGIWPHWSPRAAADWFSHHREDIRLLSLEAAIKTVETVGTPYVVGVLGGALALGLHRAASSLTYPVRLVLEMLRARIISGSMSASRQSLSIIGGIGTVAGALVAAGLVVLDRWGVLAPGTIVEEMAPHALAVAAWVCTMSISSFIQFVGRGSFTGRRLIVRRVVHTALVLGLTASGVSMFGPVAVIWFAALAELVAAPLWIPLRGDRRHLEGDGREPAVAVAVAEPRRAS